MPAVRDVGARFIAPACRHTVRWAMYTNFDAIRGRRAFRLVHRSRWVESRTGAGALDASGVLVPFPVPAHRTGRADFPHPALREKGRAYRQACLLARHSRFARTPRRGRFAIKLLRPVADVLRRFQTPVNRLPCSASEACPKAGPFTPPELPGFSATGALSDFPPGPPSLPRTGE